MKYEIIIPLKFEIEAKVEKVPEDKLKLFISKQIQKTLSGYGDMHCEGVACLNKDGSYGEYRNYDELVKYEYRCVSLQGAKE